MKRRTKIGLILAMLTAVGAVALWCRPNAAQRDLEATLGSLRRQGFKVDLTEFDFSSSPELKQRAAGIASSTQSVNSPTPRLSALPTSEVMLPAGSDCAVAIWRLKDYPDYQGDDLWPQIRRVLLSEKPKLDRARKAAVSGPIQFEPGGTGPNFTLPYLAEIRDLVRTFGMESALALRERTPGQAWDSLLAATCLVTEQTPGPMEISHLVRVACAADAQQTTWSALQSADWTEAQLADLQRRWQAVDFWNGLADTAAFSRANAMATCQEFRKQAPALGLSFQEIINSPQGAWDRLKDYGRQVQYRRGNIYEDQKALLLYFRDRELELRNAVCCSSWQQMRALPGIINVPDFQSKHPTSLVSLMNLRQMQSRLQGVSLVGRIAEGETRRRLLVTALALERYHRRNGAYPQSLKQLEAELLPCVPVDFMDGQPLRYRLTDDAHYVLYSTGLDCDDNGGIQRPTRRYASPEEMRRQFPGKDLVWPRPATPADIENMVNQQTETYSRRRYGSPGPLSNQVERGWTSPPSASINTGQTPNKK